MRKLSVPWNLEPGQHKTTEHFQPMYIYIYAQNNGWSGTTFANIITESTLYSVQTR